MPSTWPVEQDVINYLVEAGLRNLAPSGDAENLLDTQGALEAAITDFEEAMHYEPFISTGSDVTIRYSVNEIQQPPNDAPMLDFRGGFTSITSFYVGVTATDAGTALTADVDYRLRPYDAPAKGKPYSWCEFETWPFVALGFGAYKDSIRITGKRGYSLTCPSWAFQAVKTRAAKRVMGRVITKISGGASSWKEGDVQRAYEKILPIVTADADEAWKIAMAKRRRPIL